jgi:prevent-host-death family protein
MTQVSITEVKASFSEFLNRAAYGRERIVILSRGKPKAAVIGIEDLHRLEELEDTIAVYEAMVEHRRGETISLDELEAELAGATSDVPG